VDADFEQQYQAAERAYGLGEYTEAHALASAMWDQLQSASDEHNPSLVLGWRAVVALLLGHIQLHGLQQPDQAALFYQQVLDSEPEATLAALADQGLEHCRSQNTISTATTTTTPANGDGDGGGAIPDLLKDPFLTTDPDQAKPAPVDVVTAMPWLPSDEAPKPTSAAAPNPEPNPEPMVSLEPEIMTAPTEQTPNNEVEPTPEELTATLEPDITTELTEQPASDVVEDEVDVEPTPPEPAAKELLEQSWLRVQLQPEIKNPTDSNEPMGLINRIKAAFGRSAGR
jgi:hypothetical protein